MRRRTIRSSASALLLLATVAQAHKGSHEQLEALHRRHRENRVVKRTEESDEYPELVKRGQCAFPADAGLVAVTPGSANAGWAMSPDQPCLPGNYCPYACPSGQVSMQWDPKATSYAYPASMNGGLYCDSNGKVSKPFPDKPYCASTATNIGVVNKAGGTVAFCQTVLPGNEAMLIPTSVEGSGTLAVPGTDYWAGTAAHYYINPPGTGAATACVWGTSSNPWGNWSPYVAGTNQGASGDIFIKLGWNPIYLEQATPFRTKMPDWGVKIDCPNGGCNGLPCAIDPSTNSVNQMMGGASNGAGGGNFCVVTVSKGAQANFVITGSGGSSNKGGQFYQSSSAVASSSPTTTPAASSSSSTTSTTAASSSKTTTTSSSEITASSSSRNTTTIESETSTLWSMPNSTTTYSGPTGQPYYSLFNNTAPQTTADAAAGATATGSGGQAQPTIAMHTGGAPTISFSVLALAPLALWSIL